MPYEYKNPSVGGKDKTKKITINNKADNPPKDNSKGTESLKVNKN